MSHRQKQVYLALIAALWAFSAGYTGFAFFSQGFTTGTIFRSIFIGYLVVMASLRAAGNYYFSAASMIKPLPVPAPPAGTFRVAMVTTFVPGKEPLRLLAATLDGMAQVRYPHDCFVLDEGDSEEVKALVQRLDDHYRPTGIRIFHYTRPDKTIKQKGSNITAWLNDIGYANYDVASFFDADHRPFSDYLERTLGYIGKIRKGKRIVFVQTPAPYGNRAGRGGNLISEGAEQMRQPTFGVSLPASYGQDTPLIIGDHTTIDLHALHEIGGYQVHQSDDLLTAKKLLALGYMGVYALDEIVAYGEGPRSWEEHFTQQEKWAFGVVDLQVKHWRERRSGLGIRQYVMWVVNALGYFFMLETLFQTFFILSLLFIAPKDLHLGWVAAAAYMPLMALRWGTGVWWQQFYPEFRSEGWRWFRYQVRLVGAASWPYALQGIVLALRRKPLPRVVTPKEGDPTFKVRWFIPHLAVATLVLLGEAYSFWSGVSGLLLVQLFGATFLFYNLFPIVHALWIHGRSHRNRTGRISWRALASRVGLSAVVVVLLAHSIIPYRSLTSSVVPRRDHSAAMRQIDPALSEAWNDFSAGHWQDARKTIDNLEKNCPDCWVQGRKIDAALSDSSNAWPELGKRQSIRELYERYGPLYAIGAAEYIRFKAALEVGDMVQARKSLSTLLREFPHAQVYNPAGYLWSPVIAAWSDSPGLFNDVVRHDIPNTHPLRRGYQWLSFEASARSSWSHLRNSITWPPAILASALLLLLGGVRATLRRLVQARNSMIIFATGLSLIWISPTVHQWLTHIALGYPIVDLAEAAIAMGFGALFVLNLSLVFATGLWMFVKDNRVRPQAFAADDVSLPSVTVQVAIRHEPFPLLKRTIDNLLALNYPRALLEIQIIDNSDTADAYREVKAYCDLQGVSFIHRDGTEGYKARNLNIGLNHARGDFLLILDADSMVEPETLLKMLPYFQADPKLAYIQLRAHAANESLNLLTRTLALGIRATQKVHDLLDRYGFARFDGRNGIIRRQALLDIGNWPEMVSEDFVASIRMRLLGYHGRFIYDIETTEDVPENFTEFIKQRRKWSFGTSEVVGMHAGAILRSPHLSFSEKFNLFQVMGDYVINSLAYLLAFSYFHFSVAGALLIFVIYQLPLWIANWRRPLRILRLSIPTIAAMGALMPSIFLGVFASFLGLDHGFPITLKQVGAKRISLLPLLRLHAFAMTASIAFFVLLFFIPPRPLQYLISIQPAVIMMMSALLVPFIANYLLPFTTSKPPGAHGAWRRFLKLRASA